jgi:hypothetical protein
VVMELYRLISWPVDDPGLEVVVGEKHLPGPHGGIRFATAHPRVACEGPGDPEGVDMSMRPGGSGARSGEEGRGHDATPRLVWSELDGSATMSFAKRAA